MPTNAGVDIRRKEIDSGGEQMLGWVAEWDGTTATGISREGALCNLVRAVGREAL